MQKQYRAMAKLVHPDKFTDPGSKSAMQKLNEALETLSDQALRAEETTQPASTAMSVICCFLLLTPCCLWKGGERGPGRGRRGGAGGGAAAGSEAEVQETPPTRHWRGFGRR